MSALRPRRKRPELQIFPANMAIIIIIITTIISNLPQHPELPHQHGLVHGGLPVLYVHHSLPPPPRHHQHHHHLQPTSTPRVAPSARRPSCSLCPPSSSLSSSSSSSSSPTYLNTPSCPISTAFLLSMSTLFLLIIIIIIIIISNLPQHPELPHQHGGLLALYVHPLPPYHHYHHHHHHHHHHLQPTSTPRVAPSARPGARRPSCSLCVRSRCTTCAAAGSRWAPRPWSPVAAWRVPGPRDRSAPPGTAPPSSGTGQRSPPGKSETPPEKQIMELIVVIITSFGV